MLLSDSKNCEKLQISTKSRLKRTYFMKPLGPPHCPLTM